MVEETATDLVSCTGDFCGCINCQWLDQSFGTGSGSVDYYYADRQTDWWKQAVKQD